MLDITSLARSLHIDGGCLTCYGRGKAKVSLNNLGTGLSGAS